MEIQQNQKVDRDSYVAPLYPQNVFKLHESFLAKFAGRQPNWGPVGYAVFKRTYARDLTESQIKQRERFNLSTEGSEEWWEVCQRCAEEVFSRQRQQLRTLGQHWDPQIARRHAEEYFQRQWDGKFTGSGRMLWFLGTEALEIKGSAAAYNCAAVSTKFIADDFAEPFVWMMDLLMCGAGVGTDVRGAGKLVIQQPKIADRVHVVGDSREGWCEAFGILLRGYGHGEEIPREFDYSQIRPAGAKLKTFGGRSGGPEPLKRLIRGASTLLDRSIGKAVSVDLIADIANMIGVCVVAGGNRRSSEIIIGDADDQQFIALKDDTELRDIRQRKEQRRAQVLRGWSDADEKNASLLEFQKLLTTSLMSASEHSVAQVAAMHVELAQINAELDAIVSADPEWSELSALEYAHPLSTHRWASNNSVLSEDDTDFDASAEARERNGEPGNVWMRRIQARGRMIDPPMPGNERVILVNPCVVGDTRVMTDRGMVKIKNLVGEKVGLRVDRRSGSDSGEVSTTDVGAFFTGWKDIIEINTVEGYSIRLTPDHRVMTSEGWLAASKLRQGMLVHITNNGGSFGTNGSSEIGGAAGWLHGGGAVSSQKSPPAFRMERTQYSTASEWEVIEGDDRVKVKQFYVRASELEFLDDLTSVPEAVWLGTRECQVAYVVNLFSSPNSSAHSPVKPRNREMWFRTNLRTLAVEVQQILLNLGVQSRIETEGSGTEQQHYIRVFGDSYDVFTWEIAGIGEIPIDYAPLRTFLATVQSVDKRGVAEVFDLTEPTTSSFVANGIVVSNCGEIGLEHHELCNVPETFPSRHDSLEDWKRSLKYAYILGKTISCIPTHDPKANAVMARNHRLGISVAGVAELYERLGAQETRRWLDEGYRFLRELDEEYSAWMGVGRSVRLTSVKPGGSTPLLFGVEGGMKWPSARHYYRLVRIDHGNPLLDLLRDAGYRIEPDFYAPSTSVAYFPVKLEGDIRTDSEVSIWEKAEVLTMLQAYWSDNMVSVTLSFRPDETREVRRVLAMFADRWKTCSFLPMSDAGYIQAPYTPVTEAQYRAASSVLKPLNFAALRGGTHDEGREDRYCDGDVCEIRSK